MVQTTPDIGLSGAVCTPGVTSSQMVRSSSENDIWFGLPSANHGKH
ncbi:NTP-binding protein [Pseudomonas aeruginosa]|nr:NTP-binding protein [Pseudomonas aeruginosa]TEE10829.1 NTP-binding protein [Pseudomonas aeruginosa]